jgi:hypothetical protein
MGISAEPLDLAKIRRNQRRLKGLLSNREVPNDHIKIQHFPVSVGKKKKIKHTLYMQDALLHFESKTIFSHFRNKKKITCNLVNTRIPSGTEFI